MSNDNLGPWSAFNNESTEEAESQEKQFHVDSVNSNASSNKGNTQNVNWLKVFAPSIVFLLLEMIGTMNLLGVWISLLLSVVGVIGLVTSIGYVIYLFLFKGFEKYRK